jgi:hypothetical protein
MESTATMGLVGFDILWRGESDVGGCEGGPPRKNATPGNNKEGGQYILNRNWRAKMEIPGKGNSTKESRNLAARRAK